MIHLGASISGAGQLVVLGPALGTSSRVWAATERVIHELAVSRPVRILRFDLPGHGSSPAASAGFSIGDVAAAGLALVDEHGGGAFHYAGLSFGGAVGIELALRQPTRLKSLALVSSLSAFGTPAGWSERATLVREQGTGVLRAGSAQRWWCSGFPRRDPVAAVRALEEQDAVDDLSYAWCAEALASFNREGDVSGLTVPTLLIAGADDVVTTPEAQSVLAQRIPGARLEEVVEAGHLVPLEHPETVGRILSSSPGCPSAGN